MPKDNVLIFRKRILPYSETFIAAQGKHLTNFSPVFTGFQEESSGIELLKGQNISILENHTKQIQLNKLLLRTGLGFNAQWKNELESFQPKLIHAHFGSDGFEAAHLANRMNIPLITTFHGYDITITEKRKRYLKKLPALFNTCSKVIAVSEFIKQQLIVRGCPENKIEQHYMGIDTGLFTQQKVESQHPSILFVGRLTEKKGCLYLLQAVSILKKRFPELKTTIIGNGPLQKKMEDYCEKYQLNVEFMGSQPQNVVRNLISKSWIFCVPSIIAKSGDAEGLGMVFLEAQSLETPVVSFATGGIPETVDDGNTGLLAENENLDMLTENLARLLESKSLREQMGKSGKRRVQKHFDINLQCKKLEVIYRSVI